MEHSLGQDNNIAVSLSAEKWGDIQRAQGLNQLVVGSRRPRYIDDRGSEPDNLSSDHRGDVFTVTRATIVSGDRILEDT
jgi:hypothetical protein